MRLNTLTEIRHKAIHLLSLREHSRKELQQKLLLRDYAFLDVLQVLDEFVKKDLQSDERFAEAYTRSRRLKGYGPERIQMELQQRGVAEELIRTSIDEQDESWHEAAVRVYQKKFGENEPKTFQEKVKRQQFMRYRGFKEVLSLEEWQLREVELGIEAADSGKFASQEEVDQVFKKWLTK